MSQLTIANAAPDTGNLGVSALCFSVLEGVLRRAPGTRVVLFDHGVGVREAGLETDRGVSPYALCGAKNSRRFHQAESLPGNLALARLGYSGRGPARVIRQSDALMDISGGDSFSDIYGARRFETVCMLKHLALRLGTPLVLLPQTYGPFASPDAERAAARFVREASVAWARDERSYEVLRELAGDRFDPERHRCGVDVAFALGRLAPGDLPDPIPAWLEDDAPVAGLNVSGLIYNQGERAREQYGLAFEYAPAVRELVERILASEADARVLLTPHVAPPNPESAESDERACRALVATLPAGLRERCAVAPALTDPRHAKWLISQCDWFCGTRMHSTIAGLSSGVPTATLAYSGKAQGVFESCGQGDGVADMRSLDGPAAVEIALASWNDRSRVRDSLRAGLPAVMETAELQLDHIVGAALGRCAGTVGASLVDEPAA